MVHLPPSVREAAKKALRVLCGPRGYAWAAAGYAWGLTLLNYWLMRLPGLRRLRLARAWPHTLYIEVTNVCNARCVFCAYPRMRRAKQTMTMELFRSVIDQYVAMGGDEVDITPIVGDPFVDPRIFERLDYLLAQPGIRRFHFFTNAIAMKPESSRRLLGYGGRLRVFISFGGFDRQTYQRVLGVDKFDSAVENIKALIEAKREAGSPLGIQLNLRTPKENNRGEFWDYLLEAKRAGLIEMTWMGAYDNWAGVVRDEELSAAGLAPRPMPVKSGPCHRLLTSPTVLADGRVNACACRDVEAELIIGDVTKTSLAEILRGPELYALLDRQARGDLPNACRRCTYFDPVYPHWLAGRPRSEDPSIPVGIEPF